MSFRVVLSGQALPGFTPEQIAHYLQTQLKFSETQIKALLPPARRVVKNGLDRPSAERWCSRLQQAGLAVMIEAVAEPVPADPLLVLQELASKGLKRARPMLCSCFWSLSVACWCRCSMPGL